MLTDLGAVFRSLQSEPGLRPIYHLIADRVSGHLVYAIRYRFGHNGIQNSWMTLRNILLPHNRGTIRMRCKNDDKVHIRKRVQPNPEQHKIYSVLGVKNHPGNVIKTTIAAK